MPTSRHHTEWLSLIEVSGPFLSVPVLERVFPQGLDAHDPDHARLCKLAFEEWEDNQQGDTPTHRRSIGSGSTSSSSRPSACPDEVLVEGQDIPQTLRATIAEHGETLRPDPGRATRRACRTPGRPGLAGPGLSADARPRKADPRPALEGITGHPDDGVAPRHRRPAGACHQRRRTGCSSMPQGGDDRVRHVGCDLLG